MSRFFADLKPMILFDMLPEPTAAERYNRYAAFIKQKRKLRRDVDAVDDN